MKTILTLKTSSMFFLGSVNLYKGIPAQVDTDDLTVSTVRMVNQAISSGRIESSEGILTVEEQAPVEVTPVIEDLVAEKIVSEPEPTVEETVAEPEVEAKPAPKKKTTVAKKKAE